MELDNNKAEKDQVNSLVEFIFNHINITVWVEIILKLL